MGSKYADMQYRNPDPIIQCMALRLVAAVVGGLGSSDRGVAAVHAEALKAVDKCLKDKSAPAAIKTAAASVIKAVAETGGAGLWANAGFNFEDTARVCIAGLVDPSLTVREAFAAALGEVAAASKAPSAKEAVRTLVHIPPCIFHVNSNPKHDLMCQHRAWLHSSLRHPSGISAKCWPSHVQAQS